MIWSSRGSAPNDGWSAGFITIDSRSLRDLIFGLSIWILYIVVLYIVLLYFLRLFLPSVYIDGGDARVCFYPIDSSCLRDLVLDWYTMFEWFILISISILILHLSNYSFLFLDYTSVILLLYFCYTSVIRLLHFLRLFLPSVYIHGGGAPVRFYRFGSSSSEWFILRLIHDVREIYLGLSISILQQFSQPFLSYSWIILLSHIY